MQNDDKNIGLFGIPIRKPTQKELEELLNPKKEIKRKDGFMYIPKLGLWIADEISILGKNWQSCQYYLHRKESRMLTPREFWVYYDYCKEHRKEDLKSLFQNPSKQEWLHAIVNNENQLIINMNASKGIFNYCGGDVYTDYPFKELKESKYNRPEKHKTKYFDKEDIHLKSGLPTTLKDSGEYLFWCNEERWVGMVRGWNNYKHDNLEISLVYELNEGNGHIGVRECREKV